MKKDLLQTIALLGSMLIFLVILKIIDIKTEFLTHIAKQIYTALVGG